MGSETNIRFTQISASVDMTLGGPSAVVTNSYNLLSRNLKNYHLLVFGKCEIQGTNLTSANTILDNRFGLIWNIFNLKIIKTLKASDKILIHGYYLFSTIFSLTIYRGENIYLMPHGTFELYQQSKHTYRKFFFSTLLKVILNKRKVHFLTASESEVAPLKMIFPNNPISVVGIGVNIPTHKYARKIHTEKINLIFMGRIAEKKRVDLCQIGRAHV